MPIGLGLGEALRSGPFWAIYVGALLMSFGLFVPFVHLAPYARDVGLGEGFGVLLIVLLGVGSTVGRFLFASVTGWIGRRLSFALMYVGAGAMLVMWSQSTSAPALVVFALVFGAFYGGFVAIAPSLAADYFGGRALGSIIGALYSGVAFGALLGAPVAGYAFDLFGSYTGVIAGRRRALPGVVRHHSADAGAGALAGGAEIAALTPGPRRPAIHGSASRIASSKRHGGLMTASPHAASLPGSIASECSSRMSGLKAASSPANARRRLVLDRIPERVAAGREAPHALAQGAQQALELVGRLEGRIDQHQAAALDRRQQRLQHLVAVGLAHLDCAVAGELALERQRFRRVQFAGDEAIARPQRHANQPRRARIAPDAAPGGSELAVVGRDRRQIARHGGRHAGARRADQAGDAGLRLAGAPRQAAAQIIAAGAGMGVEHEQLLVLGRQQAQQLAERRVLQDVGEVAGVIAMAIVHATPIASAMDLGARYVLQTGGTKGDGHGHARTAILRPRPATGAISTAS